LSTAAAAAQLMGNYGNVEYGRRLVAAADHATIIIIQISSEKNLEESAVRAVKHNS